MKARVGLLVCVCLCAIGVGPGTLGSARAVNIPAPDACAGIPSLGINPVTNAWFNFGALWCGLHGFYIDGSATAAPANLCPGGGAAILHFTGTIQMDGHTPVPAAWTIVALGGVYAMTLQSSPIRFAGTGVDLPLTLPCDPHSVDIAMVAAHTPVGPTPTVMVCRAAGTIGPITHDFRFPNIAEGPAAGAGTCLSNTGKWDMTYTGGWSGAIADPCLGSFGVDVTATNRSNGHILAENEIWADVTSTNQVHVVNVQGRSLPSGAGMITESPDPCTVPPSTNTNATWAYVFQE
jgi:hypothetical protein